MKRDTCTSRRTCNKFLEQKIVHYQKSRMLSKVVIENCHAFYFSVLLTKRESRGTPIGQGFSETTTHGTVPITLPEGQELGESPHLRGRYGDLESGGETHHFRAPQRRPLQIGTKGLI